MTRPRPVLVTALFDDADASAVLSIDCPMAIYTDATREALVRRLRGERPTRVQVVEPQALLAADLFEPLRRSGGDAALAVRLAAPLWLLQQAQADPFAASHFYWLDPALGQQVPGELLQAPLFSRLARRHRRFLLPCTPLTSGEAGPDAETLARLAGVDRLHWTACTGLHGGSAEAVLAFGARYGQQLEQGLAGGYAGDGRPLLTLQSYVDAEHVDLHFVGPDGSVQPLLQQLAAGWPGDADRARDLLPALAETWIVSFHAPRQLACLLESMEAVEPALLRTARRVLIDNSVDPACFADYDALCARYGLECIREGNRGMNGARMRAAEAFHRGGRHAMFWFEDDMLLVPETPPRICENGLPRHVHGLAGAALAILQREFADYVKLSFTETSRAHHTQGAWAALEPHVRDHYFPDDDEAPPQVVAATRSIGHVPYAVGEPAYSNWPHAITRRGTCKLFFEERTEPCYEAYWAARSFELLRQGRLRAAVLLASPIEHLRTQHYPSVERVDYQVVGDKPLVAPPVQAAAPGRLNWPPRHGAIFVSIANYRDSETAHTLRDLFASAAHPERVFAGVFSQVVPGEDDDCLADAVPHGAPAGHVRELRVHASESLGACWARSRILQELLQGEEYVLQIDSHSRFEPGWDDQLLDMLRRCPSERAILSAYPPAYELPDQRIPSPPSVIAANYWDASGILVARSRLLDPEHLPSAPVPGALIAAGCLFGPSAAFREVPYDPHLYFHGEEVSLSVRLWTHGWDVFAPDRVVLYHDYSSNRGRARNWHDRRDWVALNQRSFARLRHLLGIEESRDPAVLRDIGRHGLGNARTLAEFEEFADIRFAAQSIGPRARDGRFPAPVPARSMAMLREARARYLDRPSAPGREAPRAQESRSGPQSTLAATAALRAELGPLLRSLGIRSLLDAGCGDFNWMREVDLAGVQFYAGYDIVPEVIARNQQLYGDRRGHFFAVGDIAQTPLAACDAILCRHVMGEMPEEEAVRALANFRASGARYLIASTRALTHGNATPQRDLLHPPFGLSMPLRLLADSDGSVLGVWDLQAAR
jgi:SAM-dependent methyltransferase